MKWKDWLTQNKAALWRGDKLFVPQHRVCHPSCHPELFKKGIGWPDGQTCDYMMPLTDRSRIHVQCFTAPNGVPMYRVHRDKWDPDRGIIDALLHGLFETPLGVRPVGHR